MPSPPELAAWQSGQSSLAAHCFTSTALTTYLPKVLNSTSPECHRLVHTSPSRRPLDINATHACHGAIVPCTWVRYLPAVKTWLTLLYAPAAQHPNQSDFGRASLLLLSHESSSHPVCMDDSGQPLSHARQRSQQIKAFVLSACLPLVPTQAHVQDCNIIPQDGRQQSQLEGPHRRYDCRALPSPAQPRSAAVCAW